MRIIEYCWRAENGWDRSPKSDDLEKVSLLLIFGATEIVKYSTCVEDLQRAFPDTLMIGCSTGGEIIGTNVQDDSLVATAISFSSSWVKGACVAVHDYENGEIAASELMDRLPRENLRHVLILADGILTNGSEIVRGINDSLPPKVAVTGGMAGDGLDFSSAYVIFNGRVENSLIAAIGLYGERLKIGYGTSSGWLPFGPQKMITEAEESTIYEVDGHSVLDLYKQYLGEAAENFPADCLLFPLSITTDGPEDAVIRTVTGVDEAGKSLSFAGDVPKGSYAQFMRAVPNDLIDGAAEAAHATRMMGDRPDLCILISCIGRKAVLKQLTEEEIEVVADGFTEVGSMVGFYSYGEIAPLGEGQKTSLHNQTMTITAISEEYDA